MGFKKWRKNWGKIAPLSRKIKEYGLVLQNFWNNANQKVVKDPFDVVR